MCFPIILRDPDFIRSISLCTCHVTRFNCHCFYEKGSLRFQNSNWQRNTTNVQIMHPFPYYSIILGSPKRSVGWQDKNIYWSGGKKYENIEFTYFYSSAYNSYLCISFLMFTIHLYDSTQNFGKFFEDEYSVLFLLIGVGIKMLKSSNTVIGLKIWNSKKRLFKSFLKPFY